MPDLPKKFITLLKAIDNRDATNMSSSSRILLDEIVNAPSMLQKYILTAGLIGDLSNGHAKEALSLVREKGSRLNDDDYQSVLMRLLVGHIKMQLESKAVKK